MIKTQFKFIDRNYPDTIVLIPGWATDCSIFGDIDLRFNYLKTISFSPLDFVENLSKELKKYGVKKISIFGFSMGGFLAAEFASRNESKIENMFLVGIRKKYKIDELEKVRGYLRQNKDAYLARFYSFCFSGKEEISRFKKGLFKEYCGKFNTEYLIGLLDYLENAQMMPEYLDRVNKIRILHGELDTIAPISEAFAIKEKLPQADFVEIKGSGHIPFFRKDFNSYI